MRTTPTPLNIGQAPQLFFDSYMIEMVNFVTRATHQPKKHAENPLLRKDRPWETLLVLRTSNYNVHWDKPERLYKLWYADRGVDYDAYMSMKPSDDTLLHWDLRRVCDWRILYAESGDGIHWEKSELDYRRIDGRKTNILPGQRGLRTGARYVRPARPVRDRRGLPVQGDVLDRQGKSASRCENRHCLLGATAARGRRTTLRCASARSPRDSWVT